MAEEFHQLGPNLRPGAAEILFRQQPEQLGVGLIVEAVLPGPTYCSGVKIVIGRVQMAGANLAEHPPIAIQGRVETGFEHLFRVWRRGLQLQHLERANLRDELR